VGWEGTHTHTYIHGVVLCELDCEVYKGNKSATILRNFGKTKPLLLGPRRL